MDATIPNVFSVDVEDYYQVSAFEHRITRDDWDRIDSRVEDSTLRTMAMLDVASVRGTFFILGWVADRFPKLVKRIADAGHEIASHGYWHQLVYDLTPESFAKDVADSCDAIVSACGVRPTAYRAPSFSIVQRSLWALEVLVAQGFSVDSSIFPMGGHDRYGIADAPRHIHLRETACGPIEEFPPSLATAGKMALPIGGGYFRLMPLRLTSWAIKEVRRQGRPAMFYIHPWEIDPQQPKMKGIPRTTRFRHYVGLKSTEKRLVKLLAKHPFDTMSNVMGAIRECDATIETPPSGKSGVALGKD